jgi:PIN domain nuclease of toxin-antitoxin system
VAKLLWDASALAKRYSLEIGSDSVDAVFRSVPLADMASTVWGYAETYSVLLRRLHDRRIDRQAFSTSIRALQNETVSHPDFGFLRVDEDAVIAGISLMQRHNINATDAAILRVFLDYTNEHEANQRSILIASDQRLLRAAQAEGLAILNPESMSADQTRAFLSTS